jgi:transcriptional regulator NrdR family protein
VTCPSCEFHTQVIDSRPRGAFVYRRRICMRCQYRFTTIELYRYDRDTLAALRPFRKARQVTGAGA